jgi:hypothetical protein
VTKNPFVNRRVISGASRRVRANALARGSSRGIVDDLRYQTDSMGLGHIDPATGEAELAGPSLADDPAKRRVQRGSTELDLGVAEGAVLRTDTDIAERDEVEASAQGRTVHGGDERLGKAPDVAVVPRRGIEQRIEQLGVLKFFEIEPGTEDAAAAGQDDRADGIITGPAGETR